MNKMLIEFKSLLVDYEYDRNETRWGPVFNRWLPDEASALEVDCDDFTKIRLWFSGGRRVRRGIEQLQNPITNSTVPDLDGGNLLGQVELNNISESEMQAVMENKVGSDDYVRLGKRLVTKVIFPYANKLRNILAVTYGQYWIGPFPKWDSRECSLGYYCKHLIWARWSVNGGETWSEFIPNASTANIRANIIHTMGNEQQYINKKDWSDIESFLKQDYFPTFGASILNQAHRRRDQEEFKFALIEAVTALEIALEERVLENIKTDKSLVNQIDNFWKLSMSAKLTIVSSLVGGITSQELQDSIKAISLRNAIAHEAKEISDDADTLKLIDTLIKTISKILITPPLKFPQIHFDE